MDKDIDTILNEISPEDTARVTRAKDRLEEVINHLINNDFEKLIRILYRIDISEEKLKVLLKENDGKNAASVIADLVIERQVQKIKSRQQFAQQKDDSDADENEKW